MARHVYIPNYTFVFQTLFYLKFQVKKLVSNSTILLSPFSGSILNSNHTNYITFPFNSPNFDLKHKTVIFLTTSVQIPPLCHFGSYKESKLSVTQSKGRYSTVQSSQLFWAGQYKIGVQYDFQFTSEYSTVFILHLNL